MADLTMFDFLSAVHVLGIDARESLIDSGCHPRVVYAKAEKAARKGYTEYGVVADRPWLTDEGRAFMARTIRERAAKGEAPDAQDNGRGPVQ